MRKPRHSLQRISCPDNGEHRAPARACWLLRSAKHRPLQLPTVPGRRDPGSKLAIPSDEPPANTLRPMPPQDFLARVKCAHSNARQIVAADPLE